MALDPSIILQGRGVQLPDVSQLATNASQLRNLKLSGQAQQLSIQQHQKAQKDQETIANLYRANTNPDGTINNDGVIQGLAQAGLGDKIPEFQQQAATTQKDQAGADTANLNLLQTRLTHVGGALASLVDKPNLSHDDVISTVNSLVNQKWMSPQQGADIARQLPGPDQLRGFLQRSYMGTMNAQEQIKAKLEMAPKYNEQNRGDTINQGTVDPLTGQRTAGANVTVSATPGQKLAAATREDVAQSGRFSSTQADLLAAVAARGISLPTGMRSKEQQIATLDGLLRKYPDKSPDDIADGLATGQINFNSDKKAATVAAGQEGKVATAVNELSTFGDQALEASAKVPRGSFIPVTQLLQMKDSAISDPNLLTLKLKLNALNNAYNVLSARGGTDAESRAHVQKLFASATGPEGIAALVKGLKEEGAGAKTAAADASHVGSKTSSGATVSNW